MEKLYKFLIPVAAVAFVVLMAGFGGGDGIKYSGGAPAGYTNSPGDGQNCSHCMGGTAEAVTGWITSEIPLDGYIAGVKYNIAVTVTGTGNKGFECSPQHINGDLVGMLTAGSDSKLVGGDKYVTHTSATTMDPKVWIFQWTAPNPGQGDITFYASAAVGKLNTKTTTLTVQQSTVGIETLAKQVLKIFPNPVRDQINLSYNLAQTGLVTVDLFSVTGRNVASLFSDIRQAGDNQEVFSVDQGSGVYFLRFQTGDISLARKLIVQ